MTEFTVRNQSSAAVAADRAEVWRALTDPDLLPRLTPYLQRVDAHGDRWTWHLVRIPVLGAVVAPTFTERMFFDEPSLIRFDHDPEQRGERAGVEGEYRLAAEHDGTHLAIDLAITVELPFPHVAGPAVRAAMKGVVAGMGYRFSTNLVRHLGG
jgi:carbon monoxide dehydrogenase subunit G